MLQFVSNSLLTEFLAEHGNTPGILDAQDDGIDRVSITVFFDSKKLGKNQIPSDYQGCNVDLFDVRAELKSALEIVKRIDKSGKEHLSNRHNKATYNQFKRTILVCKKLLQCE